MKQQENQSIILSIVFLTFFVTVSALRNKVEFENCGSKNDPIVLKNLTIYPVPLPLPGDIVINTNLTIKEDLPPKTFVNVKLYRETKVIITIDVKIPCIGGLGSCSYNICELVTSSDGLFCNFFPQGRQCKCPMFKGNYATRNFRYKIPKLGGIISWLAQGNYKAEVKIVDNGKNRQLGCFKVKLALNKA